MIDRTSAFQEIVRKKNSNNKQWILQAHAKKNDKHKKDIILEASYSILNTISTLESFLNEHKESYINVSQHISSAQSSKMTDRERDEIDKLSMTQMQVCKSSIEHLESLIREHYIERDKLEILERSNNSKHNSSANTDLIRDDPNDLISRPREVLEIFSPRVVLYLNIVDQLKLNLKDISSTYKKLKTFRLNAKIKENEKFIINTQKDSFQENPTFPLTDQLSRELSEQQNRLYYDKDVDFDEDEKLIYERQNESLVNELETLSDQIQVVNKQVEELSQLFDEITPLILSHREIIDSIYSTNAESTNKIIRGNNQIYEATKKTFDFRVMVLLFLIISSLVLLFLNWYRD